MNNKRSNWHPGVDDDGNGFIDDFNGWNFISDSNILGVTGHGTSVTGLIGGKGNNGIGMAGVNWNVKMMFCNVDLVSEVVAAFAYVIEQRRLYNTTNGAEGAFVVVTNGSFGKNATFCSEEPAWGAMYDLLGEVGILNVAATANENWDVEEVGDMPTTCGSDFLVSVTGTDINDERVSNAAFGQTSIDLAAPGRETITTTLDDRYNDNFGGTSAACPHVSGAVALLYSLPCTELGELALTDPPAAALLMRDALLKNVFPIASLKGRTVTEGRVDVYESMKYLHAWCIGNETDRASEQVKDVYLGRRGLVRLFPNPVSTLLTVDFSAIDFGNEATFQVFNMLGQEVQLAKKGIAKPF
ncbi:MAG: S8 family serine peptidase [Saprospiraceae bacterium]